MNTTLTISARDDGGTNSLEMCVSNSGYLQGCSWEKYSASKNWKVTGSLDGLGRTVYLSIRDSAGNIVNREAKYTVYKDCSNQKKEYTDGWSACSDACQVGYQTRNYAMKDEYTGKVCSSGTEQKNTVTFSVVSSTTGNNGWYRNISIRANLPSGTSSSKYCITTGTCTPSTNLNINNPTISFTGSSAQKICVQPTGGSVSTCSCCSDSYKVDNVAPTAKISTSCEGSGIKVSASGSSDAHSGIKTYYFSNNGNTWYSSTSNTYTFSNTNSGTFYVKVVDTAGNTSSTVSEAKSCGPTITQISSDGQNFDIIVPINNTTAVGLNTYSGDECDKPSRVCRNSYVTGVVITYQNGTINLGNEQTILSGTYGSGYNSNTQAVRLTDSRFLVCGNSSSNEGSSVYAYEPTCSIMEVRGNNITRINSVITEGASIWEQKGIISLACDNSASCYMTIDNCTNATGCYENYQISISGNSISAWSISDDNLYSSVKGDPESKANTHWEVHMNYFDDASYINNGSGGYISFAPRNSSTYISVNGQHTSEKYRSGVLCRTGTNKFVFVDDDTAYFYQGTALIKPITNSILDNASFNTLVPMGDVCVSINSKGIAVLKN